VLNDPVVATAILDRLLHHSHVLTNVATATDCARSAARGCSNPQPRRPRPKHQRDGGGWVFNVANVWVPGVA